MDLGIAGRHAVLLGSSRGLGRACAEAIAREGVHVVVNGRNAADVERAAAELAARHGVHAVGVVGDSATPGVHDALLAACPAPDIVLVNGEGPPPMPWSRLDDEALDAALRQAFTRLALTGVLKGLSKEVVRHNVTVNQLLPERFDTARQQQMARLVMQRRGITYDEARAEQVASIRAGRLGRPEEFGDAFAYLCSAQAGHLSGQSLQLDGGSYEGVF